jgi:hypothetical protein
VPVWTEAQVDQVEHWRRSSDLLESRRVLGGSGLQITGLHRHLMNLTGRKRRMIEKALAQMDEVSVRIFGRGNAFVDLHDMDSGPRHVGSCQRTQHQPGCVATAYCQNKTAARGYCQPGFFSNDCCSFLGDGGGRVHYFNVHRFGHDALSSTR